MARAVVTGGAGFLGSHLCRELLNRGWDVVALDNLATGRLENLDDCRTHDGFSIAQCDVSEDISVTGPLDAVLHFASAASPSDYLDHPIETLRVGSAGTERALELARDNGARFLLASTSEVYGDPHVHPQPESYWGNVNPIGPRSCYDEAKRYAEALTMAYQRVHGVDTRIVRIFNTYGPGLRPADGRVVSNFLAQAMAGKPLTVYGAGSQSRSFCFVDDQVRGILAMLDSEHAGPINIGNPDELTVIELAQLVLEVTGSSSEIIFEPLPVDDPVRRRPDISLAARVLDWRPEIDIREGLSRTHDWCKTVQAGE
jgi:dTDP-glucose 4,6-dehydratase